MIAELPEIGSPDWLRLGEQLAKAVDCAHLSQRRALLDAVNACLYMADQQWVNDMLEGE